MDNKKTYVIDIDDTIAIIDESKKRPYRYIEAIPNIQVIKKIKEKYEQGHQIILFTARGMNTFGGDAKSAEGFHKPILLKWLKKYDVCYHQIIFGKPWGPNVWYVDDRAMKIDEFLAE
jgi:capsule biosynthesis phosphatase